MDYGKDYTYKKAGVILIGIDSRSIYHDLLLTLHGIDDKSVRLIEVMDELNRKYGPSTLSIFSVGNRQAWAMCGENMSPCYMMNWSDVPIALAR